MDTLVILQSEGLQILMARLRDLAIGAEQGAINLLLAIAVAVVGWGFAVVVSGLVRLVLRMARFNEAIARIFGPAVVGHHEPTGVASWAIYWTILVVTGLLALDTLGFNIIGPVGERLIDAVPRIVAAAVILLVGVFAAILLGGLARRFFETAGMRGARPRAHAVTFVVVGFTVLVALEQLGFAAQFVMALGIAAAAALALAVGLAFGLGCRDLARDFVIEYLRSLESDNPERPVR